MSTNFIEKFIHNYQLGAIGEKANTTLYGIKNQLSGKASMISSEIMKSLYREQAILSEMVPSFIQDIETIPDDLELKADLALNEASQYITGISRDTYEIMVQAIINCDEYAKTYSENNFTTPCLTMLSADLTAFELYYLEPQNIIVDSYAKVIIATCPNPLDVEDCLVYAIDDQYYFNSKIRSKGYYRGGPFVPVNDVWTGLLCIADWADINFIRNDVLSSLKALCEFYELVEPSTVVGGLHGVMDWLEIDYNPDDDILTKINLIHKYYYDHNQLSIVGCEALFQDLMHDLALKATTNDVLLQALDQVQTNNFVIDQFMATVNAVGETSSQARQLASDISSAYTSGGVLNVVSYIQRYMRDGYAITQTTDVNHPLVYTDNKSLTGAELGPSIVMKVAGSILTVGGMILTTVVPWLGVIISGAGLLLSKVPDILEYNVDTAVYPAIKTTTEDRRVLSPYFPHGFWQGYMSRSSFTGSLRQMIDDGIVNFEIPVPGGLIIFGPDANDTNRLNYEFHPALCDYEDASTIGKFDVYFQANYNDYVQDYVSYDIIAHPRMSNNNSITEKDFANLMKSVKELDVEIGTDGYVHDEVNDALLRYCLMRNVVLFSAYISVIDHGPIDINDPQYGYGLLISRTQKRSSDDNFYWYPSDINETYLWLPGYPQSFTTSINPIPFFIISCSMFKSIATGHASEIFHIPSQFASYMDGALSDAAVAVSGSRRLVPDWNQIVSYADASFWNSRTIDFRTVRFLSDMSYTDCEFTVLYDYSWADALIIHNKYMNCANQTVADHDWMILTPKYNRSTFVQWIIILVVAAVVIITTTVIASKVIKKRIERKQLSDAAKLEGKWDELKANPDDPEAIKAYRKQVKRNNRFSSLTGGTKYSNTAYWNQGYSEVSSGYSSILSTCATKFSKNSESNSSELDEINDSLIIKTIRGY